MSGGVANKELKGVLPGDYRLRIMARGQLAGPEAPKLEVRLDDAVLTTFTVPNVKAKEFEIPVKVPEGTHRIGLQFTNDYYNAQTKEDRNLLVDSVALTGPLGAITYPESHRRIVPYEPAKEQEEATARKFVAAFASRAFRRPATPQDLDRLMPVYEAGAKGGLVRRRDAPRGAGLPLLAPLPLPPGAGPARRGGDEGPRPRRLRDRLAAELLPVVHHARRGASRPRGEGQAGAARRDPRPSQAHDRRPPVAGPSPTTSPLSG